MYRIMIVDDEPLILAGISSMLNWEEYGCTIAGKASNGQLALAQLQEVRPDIIITDIKMPAMDGIAFMRKAVEQGCAAKFILLTNLEEFSFAQEALRLGAVDYLVKLELDEESLAAAIQKAVEKLEAERPAAQEAAGDENTIEGGGEALTEERIQNYFRRLLIYDTQVQADGSLLTALQERFSKPVLMLINFNYGLEGFSAAFTREDQKKVMGFAEDIISGMVSGFFGHHCLLRREQNGFVLILSSEGVKDYETQIQTMSGKFKQVVKDYFEVPISIAVSRTGSGLSDLPDLLYQAMSAMNDTYYESTGAAVFYSERCEENLKHSSNFNISFLKKDISAAVRQNDGSRFGAIMDEMISLFSECKPSRPQAVNACNNLYYFTTSLFEERQEADFPYAVDIVGQLNRMDNLNTVISWLTYFRDAVVKVLDGHKDSRVDKNIELAQEYVKEHYKEKITLGAVADALNISQGYLSSTYKKQTGKNFSDYVTEVKIEKAKELIGTYQYMMYEISDMLGFDTQYYFSSVFKKVTGMTPKEYESMTLQGSKA